MANTFGYGLMAALVGVAVVVGITTLGNTAAPTTRPSETVRPFRSGDSVRFAVVGSPKLVATSTSVFVECPQGYSFTERAAPVSAPQVMSCEYGEVP